MTLRNRTSYFLIIIISSLILSCGSSKKATNEGTLAYFVPGEKKENLSNQTIRVSGDMNTIVSLITETITEHTGAPSNVVRTAGSEEGFGGKKEFMKIITGTINVDSVDTFKKIFLMGYYILESPKFTIKPNNMRYSVEAVVSVKGRDIYVDFSVDGATEWSVYEIRKNGKLKLMPKKYKAQMGVGKFTTQKEVTKISRIGNEVTEFEDYTVSVDDQPISNGNLESNLYNTLITKFAIANLRASLIRL